MEQVWLPFHERHEGVQQVLLEWSQSEEPNNQRNHQRNTAKNKQKLQTHQSHQLIQYLNPVKSFSKSQAAHMPQFLCAFERDPKGGHPQATNYDHHAKHLTTSRLLYLFIWSPQKRQSQNIFNIQRSSRTFLETKTHIEFFLLGAMKPE